MKKRLLSAAVLLLAAVILTTQSSCNKVKELAKSYFNAFNTNPIVGNFAVPIIPDASGNYFSIDSIAMDPNLDSIIKANTSNQFGIDDIDGIYLNEMRLELENADNENNWQNFSEIGIMLIPNQSGRSSVELGPWSIEDSYAATQNVNVDKTINLKDHVSGSGMIYYVMRAKARKPTTKELKGSIYVSYTVK